MSKAADTLRELLWSYPGKNVHERADLMVLFAEVAGSDRLERIEKLVQERAAGGHEVIRIADLQLALDGAETPIEPKLTTADVDAAWLSYQRAARDPRMEARAWDGYTDILKKWRAQQ